MNKLTLSATLTASALLIGAGSAVASELVRIGSVPFKAKVTGIAVNSVPMAFTKRTTVSLRILSRSNIKQDGALSYGNASRSC